MRNVVHKSGYKQRYIISYGIMMYCRSTDSWILVQRKESIEFINLMKSKYKIQELQKKINNITLEESIRYRQFVISKNIKYLKESNIVLTESGLKHTLLFIDKFNNIILNMIDKGIFSNSLQWTMPKGLKLSQYEESRDCAYREFYEEVGIDINKIDKDNIIYQSPYSYKTERYNDSLHLITYYWGIVIDTSLELPPLLETDTEVSTRDWIKTDHLIKYLKIDDICYADTIKTFLNSYKLHNEYKNI